MSTKSLKRKRSRADQSPSGGMEDVARISGVSMMTVSRTINSPDKVAPVTRAKVHAAIARLGYVPNLTAGSLASSRTRIIAAVVPTIDNSIFAETVRGLSETLSRGGYQLLLAQSGYGAKAEDALVTALLGRRVDGIVLTGIHHAKQTVSKIRKAAIPVVETWDMTAAPIDMVAGFSNFDAGREMGRYLLSKGHRRLAFVGGADARTRARLSGFRSAIRRELGARSGQLIIPSGSSFRGGRDALVRLCETSPGLQAIFFSNDALAVGALMECRRRGIRVPQDLAIAGFADLDFAAEVEPALTTVQVRSRNIGEEAARMLIARLSGQRLAQSICDLGFVIVPRASA